MFFVFNGQNKIQKQVLGSCPSPSKAKIKDLKHLVNGNLLEFAIQSWLVSPLCTQFKTPPCKIHFPFISALTALFTTLDFSILVSLSQLLLLDQYLVIFFFHTYLFLETFFNHLNSLTVFQKFTLDNWDSNFIFIFSFASSFFRHEFPLNSLGQIKINPFLGFA